MGGPWPWVGPTGHQVAVEDQLGGQTVPAEHGVRLGLPGLGPFTPPRPRPLDNRGVVEGRGLPKGRPGQRCSFWLGEDSPRSQAPTVCQGLGTPRESQPGRGARPLRTARPSGDPLCGPQEPPAHAVPGGMSRRRAAPGQGEGLPACRGLATGTWGPHPHPLSLPCGSHTVSWERPEPGGWGWVMGSRTTLGPLVNPPESVVSGCGGGVLPEQERQGGGERPGGCSENGLRAGGVGGSPISPWAGLWVPVCVGSGQAWGAMLPLAGVGEVLENVPRWPFTLSCASRLSGGCPEAGGDKEMPSGGRWTQLPVALLCSGLTLWTHLLPCGTLPWWSGRPRGSRPPHRRSKPHKRGSVRWVSVGGVSGDAVSPLP